ncbi:excalibur calcium-binding domain-containing protein [uncultured Psychrobacter sp.]|uniref:excalibur calcium-binding domain-containing protein n=1 Tax=uncultured Psychrobacter sp. TaxID=259303 RepID=UPI0025920DA0|nr:excalibur calcium-binding domain-containing protein [uncultured Psychrobacter sp.]
MKGLLIVVLSLLIVTPVSARVNCKNFASHAQAQAYFNAKKAGYKNLDKDGDGAACDCNLGGNGKKCPKHKKK